MTLAASNSCTHLLSHTPHAAVQDIFLFASEAARVDHHASAAGALQRSTADTSAQPSRNPANPARPDSGTQQQPAAAADVPCSSAGSQGDSLRDSPFPPPSQSQTHHELADMQRRRQQQQGNVPSTTDRMVSASAAGASVAPASPTSASLLPLLVRSNVGMPCASS